MRKTTIALGLALSVGAAALAGAQATTHQGHEQGQDRPRAEDGRGPRWFGRGPGGPGGVLLRGITLTDAQKTQLEELRKAERQNDGGRERVRAGFEEARAARERGDTAAARAKLDQLRTQMQEHRQREVAAIRNILTPEQRTTFDANVKELESRLSTRDGRGPRGERERDRPRDRRPGH